MIYRLIRRTGLAGRGDAGTSQRQSRCAGAAGRANALKWLFFLSGHVTPPASEVALRIRAKVLGLTPDEATIARGEKSLPDVIRVVDGQLANNRWDWFNRSALACLVPALPA